MNHERHRALEQIMARATGGDLTAWLALSNDFRAELSGALRALAAQRGWYPEPHELDGLVVQAAIVLAEIAGAWRPDGALPWRWAKGRLEALVRMEAPARAPSLDALPGSQREWLVQLAGSRNGSGPAAADTHADVLTLERLARQHPTVALVRDALAQVASPTDVALFLAYRSQQAAGDPSPAATVGLPLDMKPATVRQRARRIQQRLERLIAVDQQYAPLAGLELFPGRAVVAQTARAA
jgi:hypothetical protein